MEEGKFDKLIKDKIAAHDLNFRRSYDKERSWNAISKKRSNGLWYKLAAALVICALSYGMLFYTKDQPLLTKTNKSYTRNGGSEAQESVQEPEISSVSRSEQSALQERHTNSAPVDQEVTHPENIKPDTSTTESLPVKLALGADLIKSGDVGQETEDIKITFKRGGQTADPEIKVFLTKGQKIKFDFFKKQAYDSAAYVLTENRKPKQPIKLNF